LDNKIPFVSENYEQDKIIINMTKATIFSLIVLIGSVVIFGIPYYFIWAFSSEIKLFPILVGQINRIVFLFILASGLFIHELIHGLFFGLFAKDGFKAIKIMWLKKSFTLGCYCGNELKIKHFIVGTIMPLIILGIIPTIVAIIIGNTPLLVFGLLYISASGGDIIIVKNLIHENKNDWILSRENEVGFNIYRKIL
jgi:hypothetical protein